jgi:hypothetical protein
MSPDEVLRHLRRIRFSPRAGRPVSLAWLGRQAGYSSRHALHSAIARGHLSADMTRRLAPILAKLFLNEGGHSAPTLGPLGGGSSVLGRPRPRSSPEELRARDAARHRAARAARAAAR